MQQLNFPTYPFRVKNSENRNFIFDSIRKKFIVLTPEEWVRQHTVQYLIQEKNYPTGLINVERQLLLNNIPKRYDVVVYNSDGSVWMIVECKAPQVQITQDTFDQIARYNMALNSRFLLVTNGLHHYSCRMDYEENKYVFLKDIPVHPNSKDK
ncbi:MAG TPA: type I restriction enzyme HsdR N-terminal domain-containing protein [Flavobacteriaceae bacterium]|nr:type I restriction enzyme HsdR N-terminal domain-containing protein [Flavobacteriaceae bacterium]